MSIKVSIVIVCYNGENYLSMALSAACKQTYSNYEIIFIDDASTDNSLHIAKSILDKSLIEHQIIHFNKNRGLANGRTLGISKATGDYLLFNDHDDFMTTNCLEKLVKYADVGYDKVFSNITFLDENNNEIAKTNFTSETSKWIIPHLQGVLLKKSLFVDNNIDFPSNVYMDDVAAVGKINMFSVKAIGIKDRLYFMRIHRDSMTHVKSWTPKSFKNLDMMLTNLTDYSTSVHYEDLDRFFEYYCMRYYYTIVMHCRDESYKGKIKHYHNLNNILHKYFPNYLDNPIVAEPYKPKYDKFHYRIKILVKAERMDDKINSNLFMNCIFLGYHIFDRIGLYKHE